MSVCYIFGPQEIGAKKFFHVQLLQKWPFLSYSAEYEYSVGCEKIGNSISETVLHIEGCHLIL